MAHIKLPYTPKKNLKEELKRSYLEPLKPFGIPGDTLDSVTDEILPVKEGRPPRGKVIRRDVPIIESKETNERRRKERKAAGLTNDFKLIVPKAAQFDMLTSVQVQDPAHYANMAEELDIKDWEL